MEWGGGEGSGAKSACTSVYLSACLYVGEECECEAEVLFNKENSKCKPHNFKLSGDKVRQARKPHHNRCKIDSPTCILTFSIYSFEHDCSCQAVKLHL